MSPATVIVTDGDERAALSLVRALGGAGYRCIVVSTGGRSLAGASRHAAHDAAVGDPLVAPAEFAARVTALARAESAKLLIPVGEASLLALLPARADFAPCIIPFPDVDAFRALSDKRRLLTEAAALGIAIPVQRVIEQRDAVETFDRNGMEFPVVLKPARSVGEANGQRAKLSVVHAADAAELDRRLRALPDAAFPLLVQQRVDGPGIGVFLLIWNGVTHTTFAHRRLTEKPPWGGVSVYRESVPLDRDLLERSRLLLDRFGWQGVAMVEYKRDARTGQPYLMEVNGRFWGSLQLAVDAGAAFPTALASLALTGSAPPARPYRIGVRSRWWWGQVDHVLIRVRNPRTSRTIAPSTVGIVRACADVVLGALRPRDYEEVFRWNDPRPFARETLRWLRRT